MSSKRKPPTKLAQPVLRQSAKLPAKTNINESKASVSAAAATPMIPDALAVAIEISSDSSSNYDDMDEEMDSDGEDGGENGTITQQSRRQASKVQAKPTSDGIGPQRPRHDGQDADTDMLSPPPQTRDQEDAGPDASDPEPTSPSFGDLIRSHEAIDVASALAPLQEPTPNSVLVQPHPRTLAPPSVSSLGTVLNQALRTDDTDLLESCLNITDLTMVQATIQRMDSGLAGKLLDKLAARMHRRPGRAHSLMSWIQWTIVAHGGALASQPGLARRLGELNRVLEERARGLNSLLMLKGKLDMLDAQMQLRRKNRGRRSRRKRSNGDSDDEIDDDDEGIVYVEGEEDADAAEAPATTAKGAAPADEFLINGAVDSEDDSEDEADDEDLDMDEPDISERESLDEDEVDHNEIDESGEEDDSDVEAAAPPTKLQKTAKAFSKRR